jgi:nucleoside-diphosphate-sugar epimerase
MRSAFLSDLFHALSADEPITLPVSSAATVALQSVDCIVENLVHALGGESVGALNLPALVVSVGELVDAVAKATGSSTARVSWNPDPIIERQFGQMPPLLTPRAIELGFRSDESLEALVAAALEGLRGSNSEAHF